MPKFRKKPVVIEARQLTEKDFWETYRWIDKESSLGVEEWDDDPLSITIKTLEGNHLASLNDWIIKGVKGEFYPCKPDIFEMTYEPVPEEAADGEGKE